MTGGGVARGERSAEEGEDDDEPFDDKMKRLADKREEPFAGSARLEQAIRENLRRLGHDR